MEEVVKNPEEVTPEGGVETVTPTTPETKPGEHTDPALLLKSLQKEREEKRRLEAELEAAQQALLGLGGEASPDGSSDEGRVLQSQIDVLNEKLVLKETVEKFPVLKGNEADFLEFRKTYPGVAFENIAKLYISEKGLDDGKKTRKGLEPVSGGSRAPVQAALSVEDIEDLRKNDYRRYQKLLREGKIKI